MYKISIYNTFHLFVKDEYKKMYDTMIVPTKATGGRPNEYATKHRIREFQVIDHLKYKDKKILVGTLEVLKFNSHINSFVNNRLNTNRVYRIHSEFADIKLNVAKIIAPNASKNNEDCEETGLNLYFDDTKCILDKISATVIADTISKIISRCEINYEFYEDYGDYVQ